MGAHVGRCGVGSDSRSRAWVQVNQSWMISVTSPSLTYSHTVQHPSGGQNPSPPGSRCHSGYGRSIQKPSGAIAFTMADDATDTVRNVELALEILKPSSPGGVGAKHLRSNATALGVADSMLPYQTPSGRLVVPGEHPEPKYPPAPGSDSGLYVGSFTTYR